MITIFNGQTRSLGKAQKKNIYAQVDVAMREKLNQFKEPSDFMVFMCIALHANADGWAWPKIGSIAIETGLGEKTVSHSIKRLHETTIDGERILLAYQPRDASGKLQAYRYLLMPSSAEVKQYENGDQVSRQAKVSMATTPPSSEGGEEPPPNEPPVVEPPVVEGGVVNHYASIRKEEPIEEAPEEGKPQGTRFASQKRGDDGTSDQPQVDTQPLEESSVDKKAAVPPTRIPDPEQVKQADDLIQRYADHKQGGKLANWPITRRAIDKAVKNGAHEDKAAINAACDELKEVVSGIANAFGWRHWFDRKSALLVISLDLPLDTIRAYVQADCDGMAKKQKDREGYGMGDALQACRLGMAAHAGPPQPKELKGEYYTDQYGELKFRYLP